PNAKLLASQAADIVEMAEKTKKNLAKYSDDALINELQEREMDRSITALILMAALSEEKLADLSSTKLLPLPDNAPTNVIIERALDRCIEIAAQAENAS